MPATASQLASLLEGKIIVSSDILDSDLQGMEMQELVSLVLSHFSGASDGIKLLKKETLKEILAKVKSEKTPLDVEIIRSSDFSPIAKDINSEFEVRNSKIESVSSSVNDFVAHFTNRFERQKAILVRNRSIQGIIDIGSMNNYMNGREISLVGMVYDKVITKNGHVLVTLEDGTGTASVLFVKPYKNERNFNADLFVSATKILKDDVIAVKGKLSNKLVIANTVVWPDIPVHMRKKTEEDIAIAFISDTQVGHKLFMEKQFNKLLEWFNGNVDYRKDLAKKVKYIVFDGDLVDGVGIYPNQDKELLIDDVYRQYSVFFDLVSKIPEYIEVFVQPGNHDAVQRAEPQPMLPKELTQGDLPSNVHLATNPSNLVLDGINVLAYHGTSLDSVIHDTPGCTYARPETAMMEVLKRRHLSPIYGGNVIVPSRDDGMVIDSVPDIVEMGHVHKNAATDYHGTLLVNSGAWQARTSFQIRLGHLPSPGFLPVYETKNMTVSTLDFNTIP